MLKNGVRISKSCRPAPHHNRKSKILLSSSLIITPKSKKVVCCRKVLSGVFNSSKSSPTQIVNQNRSCRIAQQSIWFNWTIGKRLVSFPSNAATAKKSRIIILVLAF
jgi:hypothetical protein